MPIEMRRVLHSGTMRRPKVTILLLLLLPLLALTRNSESAKSNDKADLIIHNARVYTVDAAHPWAQAVAVRGDKIVWVGDEKESAQYASAETRMVDAKGRLVLPGFIDSHFHALLGGNPDVLRIVGGDSLEQIQRQVCEF